MRSIAIFALTATLAATMSACGSDDESGADSSWKPESSVPTEPGADGFTPPGAVLTTDDIASVPYVNDGFSDEPTVTGALDISGVEQPVEADPTELADDVEIDDDETAYYVNYWVRVAGDTNLGGELVRLTAFDSEGDGAHTWASSSFEPCKGSIPDLGAPGDEGPVCTVVIVDDDEQVAAVGYDEAPDYDDEPVLWDLTA